MNDFVISRTSSQLAELGPLSQGSECHRETTWQLFQALQAGGDSFFETQPFTSTSIPPCSGESGVVAGEITVQHVLNEARRNNRVSPKDAHWNRLRNLLGEATGFEPPPCAAAGESVPRLVRRMLLRDQIEWAADHGYLAVTLRFLQGVREENWEHMGR